MAAKTDKYPPIVFLRRAKTVVYICSTLDVIEILAALNIDGGKWQLSDRTPTKCGCRDKGFHFLFKQVD